MPPQKRTENIVDMPPAEEMQAQAAMRRTGSESDFSQLGDATTQYRVRKSSLIGYVPLFSEFIRGYPAS